jgi:L-rhamnose-H+ transport protein
MQANPLLGVFLHWIGGFAAASFYIPYRTVRHWAWETYWLVGGLFAWIIVPWLICLLLVPDTLQILRQSPMSAIGWAIFFGIVWGVGGITYGLTMRYLGIALGVAVALGCCAAFGTLVPPLVTGELGGIMRTRSGQVVLLGIIFCVLGISVSGLAGMSKERELSTEQKATSVPEFNFVKGMFTAILCGIMSACFAYGLAAGKPIAALAKASLAQHGRADLWSNLPVLIVVLTGGFATNAVWCLMLGARNRTLANYTGAAPAENQDNDQRSFTNDDANETTQVAVAPRIRTLRIPLLQNYSLCAAAGTIWYLQFFFYSMGQTKMGVYDFSSWTLHMASIIIFSTLWGVFLKEWKGTSYRTHALIALGLIMLIASTGIVGYGNWLKVKAV